MNRPIKFRAWDTKKKRFDYEPLISRGECCYIDSFDNFEEYEDGRMVLQQFTGLQDRNGKEIYELDIVSDHIGIGQVEYKEKVGAFRVNYQDGTAKWFIDYTDNELQTIEVIGNVCDSNSKVPQNT